MFCSQPSLDQIIDVIDQLSLGICRTEPRLISHDKHFCYKIETGKGLFCLKFISTRFYKNYFYASKKQTVFYFEQGDEIAKVMTQYGIPAITMAKNIKLIAVKKNGYLILVYPFIEGNVLNRFTIEPDKVRCIAALLGQMHSIPTYLFNETALKNKFILERTFCERIVADKSWERLSKMILDPNLTFRLHNLNKFIENICVEVINRNIDESCLVVAHNDLQPKNVIIDNQGSLHILDWDFAGLCNRDVNFLDTLLKWCLTLREDSFRIDIARRDLFIASYKTFSLPIQVSTKTLSLITFRWIVWLAVCARYFLENKDEKYFHSLRFAIYFLEFIKKNRQKIISKIK